jgi:hypothetical protein
MVLAVLVAAFTGFQIAMESWAVTGFFINIPWERSLWALALLFACMGAGAFLTFRCYWPWRFPLVIAIPVLTQLILQLTIGSDPAYPTLTLALAIPYGAFFLLGAVLLGLPYFFVRRSRGRAI